MNKRIVFELYLTCTFRDVFATWPQLPNEIFDRYQVGNDNCAMKFSHDFRWEMTTAQ